jgi:hypothetical protein
MLNRICKIKGQNRIGRIASGRISKILGKFEQNKRKTYPIISCPIFPIL